MEHKIYILHDCYEIFKVCYSLKEARKVLKELYTKKFIYHIRITTKTINTKNLK